MGFLIIAHPLEWQHAQPACYVSGHKDIRTSSVPSPVRPLTFTIIRLRNFLTSDSPHLLFCLELTILHYSTKDTISAPKLYFAVSFHLCRKETFCVVTMCPKQSSLFVQVANTSIRAPLLRISHLNTSKS